MKENDAINEELSIDDQFDTELGPEDYGFIITADGELKSVYLPDDPMAFPPEIVSQILDMFGITDPGQIDSPTIH